MANANIIDAVFLIDDDSTGHWGNLRTGWDYINDGEGPEGAGAQGYWRLNTDKDGEVYLRRDTNPFEGGKMTFEGRVENLSGDGLAYAFGSRDDAFLTLVTKKTALYAGKKKVAPFGYGTHYLKLVIDMTKSVFTVWVDNKLCGDFPFDKPAFTFNCLRIGYGKKARGAAGVYFNKLYVNYLFYDCCYDGIVGALPDGYTVKANAAAKVENILRVAEKKDTTYAFICEKGGKATVSHPFDKAKGEVTFESKFLMTEKSGRVTIALCKGAKNIVSVYDEGLLLKLSTGKALRKHHLNVWQTVRVAADTETGKVTVWLDGKKTGTFKFENEAAFADNFKITYEASKPSTVMFADFKAWIKPPEPADYVPVPVRPKKKGDYVVGMNICSLWREGTHSGWDCISPYDDLTPVLGYYDEGLPETADWEIKFFVEHGIDYELYCWYSSESYAPIKVTPLRFAWLDGHMYAKYADMEKFALLWEAANCQHPRSLEDFKNNLVPYWLDYFFSDDRYMRVDNKAIMSCFGVWSVQNDLGGPENVREGLQYLRDEVKKLGYDDLIVMGCHADPNQLKNLGFDAFHAYHWGGEGYKLEHNIRSNDANIAKNAVHIVPTISVGFKNIGWGGDRRPLLSNQDMKKGLEYCIKNYLPKFEKNTWKSKMLHVSTWNEYGEGTYMMPSGLNGFGYLDAVRSAVCVDEPHEDIVPTEEQKARIGYLHLPDRHKLQRTKYDVRPLPATDTAVKTFTFKTAADLAKWKVEGAENVRIEKGALRGTVVDNGKGASITLRRAGLDASAIAYAKISVANREKGAGYPNQIYLVPATDAKKTFNRRLGASAQLGDDPKIGTFSLDDRFWWHDTVTGLQLQIVGAPVRDFAIESLTFYAPVKHKTVYGKTGRQLYFGDYAPIVGGELYIPLDPQSGLYGSFGDHAKFDWYKDDGRLVIYENGGNKYEFVVGRAYAVKNGEPYTLVRPVFLKDGIPTISLRDLAVIFDLAVEEKGDKVFLK